MTPYARNAKMHTPEQVATIAAQIAAFGFDVPIVVDRQGVIVKGHGRREAAVKLGLKRVPVIVTHLDEKAARAARIGDNKVAESPWMSDVLRLEFESMKADGMDIPALTGFDAQEFQAIIDGWSAAPASKADPDGDDPGLMARITVTCKQADRERVVTTLEGALRASGLSEATIS